MFILTIIFFSCVKFTEYYGQLRNKLLTKHLIMIFINKKEVDKTNKKS